MDVVRVESCGLLVGVEGVRELVVAGLVEGAEVVPDLRDVRVESDGPGVCVEGVPVLGDLVVQHTDGAPEDGVAGVPVYRLLERVVGGGVVGPDHVDASQVVPCGGVGGVDLEGLEEVVERLLRVVELDVVHAVEAAELLEHLCVVLVLHQHMLICLAGALPLAHALEDGAELEPDVPLLQGRGGLGEDVAEALERLVPLGLVLVDDTEAEVDLVGLLEVGVEL